MRKYQGDVYELHTTKEDHHFGARMFDNEILIYEKGRDIKRIHILLFLIGPWYFHASVNANLSMQYGPSALGVTD